MDNRTIKRLERENRRLRTLLSELKKGTRRLDAVLGGNPEKSRPPSPKRRMILVAEGTGGDFTVKGKGYVVGQPWMSENSEAGVALVDRNGHFLSVNDKAAEVLGLPREEIVGKTILELLPRNDAERFLKSNRKLLRRGGRREYEETLSFPDGERTFFIVDRCLQNEKGENYAIQSSSIDITQRKQIEKKLRLASLYTRSLIEASIDPLVTISPEGKITDVNEATIKVTGVPRGELIGTDFSNYFSDPRKAMEGYRKVFAEGSVMDYPLTIKGRDGRLTDVLYNASVYRDEKGKVLGVFAAARDITQRKRAEEALRRSEERYRGLVEDQTEIIAKFRIDGTLTYVNDVYCRFIGKPYGELIGRKWQMVALAEDLPSIQAKLDRLSPANPVVTIDNRVISGSGGVRWMQFVNRGFFDSAGRLIELQAVGRDITELKLAEERIHQFSQKLLTVREEEKRNISSILHHDVGSMAVGISARLNASEEEMRSGRTAEALDHLRMARRLFSESVEHLRETAAELRPPDLDLLGLTVALKQHFGRLSRQTMLRIRFRAAIGGMEIPPPVQTVLFRTAQECLTNVLKHADAKKVNVRLISAGGKGVRLTVSDDGRGFEPSLAGEKPGVHMGFRAIREMVSELGGNFTVDSSSGKGTRVRVTVPLRGEAS